VLPCWMNGVLPLRAEELPLEFFLTIEGAGTDRWERALDRWEGAWSCCH
jgi:hypothetical protein